MGKVYSMVIKYLDSKRISLLEADRTSTQGFAGGNGIEAGLSYGGGGGGGAGAVGGNSSGANSGNGGIGFINNIVGSTTGQSSGGNYYLGGGGYGGRYGGSYGSVGLGQSIGGGGSGGFQNSSGGNGTTGVVILKLLTSASFTTSGSPSSTTSGSHTILTYTSTSASSLVISSGTVDVQYLVLGGGAGAGGNSGHGGGNGSGGGGSGGILTGTLSLSAATYTVSVGAGGAGGTTSGTVGVNGSDSVFSTKTALGGGGGAPNVSTTILAASGGCGGGGAGLTNQINGASASTQDATPTNVQDNSILVEKDTGERYWFSEASTPTFEDEFDGTDDWDDAGSRFGVNTATDKFDFDCVNDTTNDASVYDLGAGTVSDTKWVLRAEVNFSTITYGEDCFLYMVMGASNQTVPEQSVQKFIGVRLMEPNNSTKRYDTVFGNTSKLDVLKDNQYYTFLESTPYYLELIRTGADTFTMEIFTGSFGGTSLGKISTSGITGITGLQYIKFANRTSGGGGGAYIGTIDNVEFYNGVTSATPATWTNPKANVGQIAQLSGSNASNSYTASSEFYSIPTDTWASAFNIASGGRARAGSAGTPTHCYLLGGQSSSYFNQIDRVAWSDQTQNATTMAGTRAWGNTVSNAVSVCVAQSYYNGAYANGIEEFTYPLMTYTSQGSSSANFAFGGVFGNSSFGFVAKNSTINKYTYSDKTNTNSGLATPPTAPNSGGHTGNSTVGISVNNSGASGNAKYDTYNISANTWTSSTATSSTPYEHGRASGSTKYNLYSTQTNTSVARSCEKYDYGTNALTSFTSVATNLDGGDGSESGASSNNTGVTS